MPALPFLPGTFSPRGRQKRKPRCDGCTGSVRMPESSIAARREGGNLLSRAWLRKQSFDPVLWSRIARPSGRNHRPDLSPIKLEFPALVEIPLRRCLACDGRRPLGCGAGHVLDELPPQPLAERARVHQHGRDCCRVVRRHGGDGGCGCWAVSVGRFQLERDAAGVLFEALHPESGCDG